MVQILIILARYTLTIEPPMKTYSITESQTCVRDTEFAKGYVVLPKFGKSVTFEGGWDNIEDAYDFARNECVNATVWHVSFNGDAFRLSLKP